MVLQLERNNGHILFCYKIHFKLALALRYWLLALVSTPLAIPKSIREYCDRSRPYQLF